MRLCLWFLRLVLCVSYARQLAARDVELRTQVEDQANQHLGEVIAKEEDNAKAAKDAHDEALAAKFKADIAQRRGTEMEERDVSVLTAPKLCQSVNRCSL